MTYIDTLAALSEASRRNTISQLRSGPKNVAELSKNLPISRPAVSQHLKVQSDAGLLNVTPKGTRHCYRLNPKRADDLRAYLDDMWDNALSAYSDFINKDSMK